MRILVLIYEYPPVGGGGGMVARDISRGLARRGHEVHVITAHYGDLPHQEDQEGVRIFRISSARRSLYKAGLTAMLGFVLAGIVQGWKHIRRWRPDLIHVHFAVPTGPVAWVLFLLTGVPYVLTAHLGDVPGGVPDKTGGWFRWIYPFTPPIWRKAARVVAVSQYTRQLAQAHYPVDIQVILNGVDLETLDPGVLSVNRPPRILFAGRFVNQKNPLQIIHTLSEIKELEWEAVLAGDGPLRQEMEQLIHAFGLEDRLLLPGWLAPEEVVALMHRSDILFMPSLSEGLPVVGVQSLALGLCILASPSGGFVDLVENGLNGYLVQTTQPQRYAQALRQLLLDPARLLAFRQASRRKAQDFDLNKIVSAYEELFTEVCKERR